MTKLSKYFTPNELKCRCGKCDHVSDDPEFLKLLDFARDVACGPLKVTGPARCPAHNKAIGGSSGSFHQKRMAADVRPVGPGAMSCEELYRKLNVLFPDKYGFYWHKSKNFVHIDSRPYAWRDIRG